MPLASPVRTELHGLATRDRPRRVRVRRARTLAQAPQQPTFRVQVDAIEIDASVTDARGNVVTDLTREDFEILENGKPQTITSFELVNIPALERG